MSVFLEVSGLILEYLTQGETPGAVQGINYLVQFRYREVLSRIFLPESGFQRVTWPPASCQPRDIYAVKDTALPQCKQTSNVTELFRHATLRFV